MATELAAETVDEYFEAVKRGELQKVKGFLREKQVTADTTNRVRFKKKTVSSTN